jgi:hypothetical protein
VTFEDFVMERTLPILICSPLYTYKCSKFLSSYGRDLVLGLSWKGLSLVSSCGIKK